jgi:hypothetical protein
MQIERMCGGREAGDNSHLDQGSHILQLLKTYYLNFEVNQTNYLDQSIRAQ